MEFKSFKLTENNCSAQNAVYEGCKTEDGVHLEYYMSSNDWDNELSCFVESRDVIRSVDGDENTAFCAEQLFSVSLKLLNSIGSPP